MNFKSKKEAIDHYVAKGNMTIEDATAYVEKDPILKSLPETTPVTKMAVVSKVELEAKFKDIDGAQSGFEKVLEEMNININALTEKNAALEKELIERKSEVSLETKDDGKFGFENMHEFTLDLIDYDRTKKYSEKMIAYKRKALEMGITSKAVGDPSANTFTDNQGGFLIPTEFSNQLLQIDTEVSEFNKKATQVSMRTNSMNVPFVDGFDQSTGVLFGNVVALWKPELKEFLAKNIEFGDVNLTLNKLTALSFVSDEMIADSPISITSMLPTMFGKALAYAKDKAIIDGTGAGQPLGILRSEARIKITRQSANKILIDDITNMFAQAWGANSELVWIGNRNIIPQIYKLTVDVGTGGSAIGVPQMSVANAIVQTLLGIPIMYSDHAKTLGTEGDLMLVNWKQYLWGKKTGAEFKSATSIHLKFEFEQMAFRISGRFAGQPWWKEAFTPENGDTKSPIVTLLA